MNNFNQLKDNYAQYSNRLISFMQKEYHLEERIDQFQNFPIPKFQTHGSPPPPTRRKEKFQRIPARRIDDLSGGEYGVYCGAD